MCVSVIGQVRAIDRGEARVEIVVDGRSRSVSILTLELEGIPVEVGDWVHVHTGFAVEVLAPTEAQALVEEQRAAKASVVAQTIPGSPPGLRVDEEQ